MLSSKSNQSVRDQYIWAIRKLGAELYWDIPSAKLTLTYKPTGQEIRFSMNGEHEINTYIEQKPEILQKIAIRLMDAINLSHSDMEAEMRWGKPTFGLNGDFHHWICSIQILKNKVSLTFHFGGLLCDEKNRLIAGSSKFLRKIEYERLEPPNRP